MSKFETAPTIANNPQAQVASSQFSLFNKARFAPFFWTQFLGAFNDNVFKNSLLIFFAFSSGSLSYHGDANLINNIAAGLFILPFFLFSALAGELADKYEKSWLIRRIKLMEIIIMICVAIAFYFESIFGLLLALFFMGSQSTFFGPVKYSIMPQHLKADELVGGNALVESGTFLAILTGTIVGGVLSKLEQGPQWISLLVIIIACFGYFTSRGIPLAAASNSKLKLNFNPFTQTWKTIQLSRASEPVFLSIMGVSWFWFLGAAYLTQLPNFSKQVLLGDETVVTSLLAAFSIGIGLGSLLCERLSGHKVELGLVPVGSIGLTFFGVDLYFSQIGFEPATTSNYLTFLTQANNVRVLIDFIGIGTFGGLYIVPLYAMIQTRTAKEHRARIIAALNIMNALFMVVSALSAIFFLSLMRLSIAEFFLILAVLNVVVAGFIYRRVPEFVMRFLIWIITHSMYRVTHKGLNNIPDEGPAVLVCNHVSFVDALIIAGACRRPVRFITFKSIYDLPVLNFIFRTGKAIPVDSQTKDPQAYEQAFDTISAELQAGEVVCIFPEGKLTTNGEIDEFKNGVEKILKRDPVPVVPMALKGLWGSFFSHKNGAALSGMPRRFWSRVELVADTVVLPAVANASMLQAKVKDLRGATQ